MPNELSSLVSEIVTGEISGKPVEAKPPVPGAETTPTSTAPATPETPATPATPKTPAVDAESPTSRASEIPESLLTPPEATTTELDTSKEPAPGSKEANMAQLRKRVEEQQALIDELKSFKASTIGDDGKVKIPEDVATTLKEREAEIERLSEALERENFVKSPRFATEFQKPIDETFGRIAATVKAFGGDDALAQTLALSPLKERVQILKEKFPDSKEFLAPVLTELDKLMAARASAIENHKAKAVEFKERDTVDTQAKVQQLRSAMKDKALTELEAEGHFIFRKLPGNEQWNAKVDQFKAAVETIINSNDIQVQTEALALSVAAPVYKQLFDEERAARIELEARLRRAGVATVSPGGGALSAGRPPANGQPTTYTPESATNAIVANLFNKG